MPVARSRVSARPWARAVAVVDRRRTFTGTAASASSSTSSYSHSPRGKRSGRPPARNGGRDRWRAAARSGRPRRQGRARRRRRRTRRASGRPARASGNQARSRWSRQVLSKLVVTRTSGSPARSSTRERDDDLALAGPGPRAVVDRLGPTVGPLGDRHGPNGAGLDQRDAHPLRRRRRRGRARAASSCRCRRGPPSRRAG